MKKSFAPFSSLFILLFALSFTGFVYSFSNYFRGVFDGMFIGSVAGAKVENPPLRVEVRGFDKAKVTSVMEDLKKNNDVVVVSNSYTGTIYDTDYLVDLTSGNKIAQISNLENFVKLGSTSSLPAGENNSVADVLIIVSK